jgi:plasmid stabilization system protein ParE
MSRRLIVRPEAEADITEASLWYEERESGLGSECFPYRIIFIVAEEAIVILAVLHASGREHRAAYPSGHGP